MRGFSILAVLVVLIGTHMAPLALRADTLTGSGAFHMNDGRGQRAAPLRVFYCRPDNFRPDGPIVMVIHGTRRNANRYLRRTGQAMRQGSHRFARGQYFFRTAEAEAARLATPFSWRLVEAHGAVIVPAA